MIKSLVPLFSKPTSLLSSPSCLWLCLFCPYFYSWTRQAFSQSHGVFLSYSRLQRGYHCYSPDTHRYFVSADVTFFENSSIYPINHPPNSDVISLPLLYLVPDTSPVPSATPPQPLQVYTRRPRTDIGPPADSSPMAPSSMTPVLSSPANLPIAIRKGTHSSRNPHPIYNFLTYHRLSSSYFAFVSTLPSVYVPKTVHETIPSALETSYS